MILTLLTNSEGSDDVIQNNETTSKPKPMVNALHHIILHHVIILQATGDQPATVTTVKVRGCVMGWAIDNI